jgi:hypothetical protein
VPKVNPNWFNCLKYILILSLISLTLNCTFGQSGPEFLKPSDTFNIKRFRTVSYIGAGIYVGTVIGLNEIWYKRYPRSGFHLFNDSKEWLGVDKAGHFASIYAECRYLYNGARWTGIKERNAIWTGLAVASAFHMTIEILDGFSSKWGFSLADVGANVLGISLFAGQQWAWKEQRILAKWSNHPQNYSSDPIVSEDGLYTSSLKKRSQDLYGKSYVETFFKDYNGTTAWLSFNLKSFFPNTGVPGWLNIAVGYGAQNLYGGFLNEWKEGDVVYKLNTGNYPRYHQYYLSLDIDTSKIPVKNRILRTILDMINFIKIPAPGLEYNSLGQFKFHVLNY